MNPPAWHPRGSNPMRQPPPSGSFAGLEALDISGCDAQPLPAACARVADDARERQAWVERELQAAGRRIAAFAGSDARLIGRGLSMVVARGLAPGRRFCEWGSGFGGAACVAAALGFEVTGIEIEPELVQQARGLAAAHALAARFVVGSYRPPGFEGGADERAALTQALGFSPLDFDLVFVYPWPAEERMVASLFRRFAQPGTLLAVYRGGLQFMLWRQPGT